MGTPQELLDQQGAFYRMVESQHGGEEEQTNGKTKKRARMSIDQRVQVPNGNAIKSLEQLNSSDLSSKEVTEVKLTSDGDVNDNGKRNGDEDAPNVDRSMISWAFELNKPELKYIIFGSICAAIEGLIWPGYAVLLAEILTVLNTDNDKFKISQYAIGFIGIALASVLILSGKLYSLTIAGERLTKRLREMVFRVMISKPVAWYDDPRNSRGILTTRLSSDASAVRGTLGDRLGVMVQLAFTGKNK